MAFWPDLSSGRLKMSEMSEVSEELRVYAVRECWTETKIFDVLKEVKDYAFDSPLLLFSAYYKLAITFQAALEAQISYRHLFQVVQQRKGDHPPKDTSKEEIEEWNASAVIIPSVDPGYGTYVRMWQPIPTPWPGSPGSPVAWCLSREFDSPEFRCDNEMHTQCVS